MWRRRRRRRGEGTGRCRSKNKSPTHFFGEKEHLTIPNPMPTIPQAVHFHKNWKHPSTPTLKIRAQGKRIIPGPWSLASSLHLWPSPDCLDPPGAGTRKSSSGSLPSWARSPGPSWPPSTPWSRSHLKGGWAGLMGEWLMENEVVPQKNGGVPKVWSSHPKWKPQRMND